MHVPGGGELLTLSAGMAFSYGYHIGARTAIAWADAGISVTMIMTGAVTIAFGLTSVSNVTPYSGIQEIQVTGVIGIYAYAEGGINLWIITATLRAQVVAAISGTLDYMPAGHSSLAFSATLSVSFHAECSVSFGFFHAHFSVSGQLAYGVSANICFKLKQRIIMTIKFIINTFTPKPFFSQTPASPDDNVYLLVMPVVLDDTTGSYTNLVNFLTAAPTGGYQYAYISPTDPAVNDVITGAQVFTPVPFPVGTSLSLSIGGQTLTNNDIGYLFSGNPERIDWIYRNGSFHELHPSKYFAYLTAAQLTTLETFVSNLLFRLLNGRHANGDLNSGTPYANEGKLITLANWIGTSIKAADVTAYFVTPKSVPTPFSQMSLLCQQFLKYTATLGLDPNNEQDKLLIAPLIKFDLQALHALQQSAGGDQVVTTMLGADMRYLAELWNQFQQAYAHFKAAGPAASVPSQLANQVSLFYGAGERLRVQAIPAGKSSFLMQVFDDVSPQGVDDGWIVSNGYSLAGHVIAVPRAVFMTAGWETTCSLSINGTVVFNPGATETSIFNTIADDWMVNYNRNDFTQAFTLLPGAAGRLTGKVRYQPASSILGDSSDPAIVITQADQSNAIPLLTVAKHTLDELEPAAAVSSSASAFIQVQPQRQFITTADLFKNGQFAPGTDTTAVSSTTPYAFIGVQLKQIVLPDDAGTPRILYKISANTNGYHPDDLTYLKTMLTSFANLSVSLVYQATDSSRKKVNYYVKLDNTVYVQAITSNANDLLKIFTTQNLQAIFAAQGKTTTGEQSVNVDLMIAAPKIGSLTGGGDNNLFNKLSPAASDSKVFLALENFYKFKFNLSVNSFSSLLQLDLGVPAALAADNRPPGLMLKGHYSNFKKFRTDVIGNTVPVTLTINNADAFLPYPDTFSTSVHFYELTHAFSNENNPDADAGELNRYQLYKYGGSLYKLKGYLEDQFAYRISEAPSLSVPLGYSQQLSNLASLVARPQTASGANDQPPAVFPILNFEVATNGSIQFNLDPNCISTLISIDSGTRTYRRLYEAFFDLFNNTFSFEVECWKFDNGAGVVAPEVSAHPELSGKLTNMVKQMVPSDVFAGSVDLSSLSSWATSAADFQTFKSNIVRIPATLTFPLTLPAGKTASVTAADVIRLSLQIKRDSSKTVAALFPPAAGSSQPVFGADDLQPLLYTDGAGNVLPNSDFTNLASAQAHLTDQIYPVDNTDNQLFFSSAYVYSKQYSVLRTSNPTNNYVKELLGEMSSYSFVPGYAAGKPATNTKLYYSPYAFLPLKPLPQLGSQQATTDLAEYLVAILSWMSYPESFSGSIDNYISYDTSQLNEQQLLSLKYQARQLIQQTLATKMASLIDNVDNRGDAPSPIPAEMAEVIALTDDAFGKLQPAILAAYTSMLISDPMLFVTAKGFGTGLFSAEGADATLPAKMDDLYLLQLIKEIREGSLAVSDPSKNYSVTQLNFQNFLKNNNNRFFLEVLDDLTYDDEFRISEASTDAAILTSTTNTTQLATQGRTAEDVLQNSMPFNDIATRTAKILTKHYNTDWNITPKTGPVIQCQYYLLPSREAPVTPVCVKAVSYPDGFGNPLPLSLSTFKSFVSVAQEWQNILNVNPTLLVSMDNQAPATFNVDSGPYFNTQFFNAPGCAPNDDTWKRIDAYVNNYYFIVEGDEKFLLNNDMIEILVGATSPVNQSAPTVQAAGGLFPTGTLSDSYLKFFDYYSHKQEYINNSANNPVPTKLPIDTDGAIKDHIRFFSDALDALLVASGGSQSDDTDSQSFLFNPGGQALVYPPKGAVAIGSVLFTQVFKQAATTSSAGTPPASTTTNTNSKYLIRVAVLTDTWSYFKCSMRVKRNWRYLQGAVSPGSVPKNDINPGFTMTSTTSDWIDYGIQNFAIDYVENQQISNNYSYLKYLVVTSSVLTIDNYLSQPDSRNMGSLLTDTLKLAGTNLLLANMLDQKTWPFEALVYDRKGNNLLAQYNQGKPGDDINAVNKAYTETNALVILSKATVIANPTGLNLDTIVNPLSKTIMGYAPFIRVTWYSQLDPNMPVISINWQLRFDNF